MRPSAIACASLAIAGVALGGCSTLGRVAVVPSLDSTGGVAVEARFTASLGVVTRFDHDTPAVRHPHLVAMTAIGVLGVEDAGRDTARAEGGVDTGVEYARTAPYAGGIGFHAAMLLAVRNDRSVPGVTIDAGLPFTFHRGGPQGARVHAALGPVMVASLLNGPETPPVGLTPAGPGPTVFRVGLGPSLEVYRLAEYTIR